MSKTGVAPTRHWDTCSLNPGVGRLSTLLFPRSSNVLSSSLVGSDNSKAAAHVAVRLSVLHRKAKYL